MEVFPKQDLGFLDEWHANLSWARITRAGVRGTGCYAGAADAARRLDGYVARGSELGVGPELGSDGRHADLSWGLTGLDGHADLRWGLS